MDHHAFEELLHRNKDYLKLSHGRQMLLFCYVLIHHGFYPETNELVESSLPIYSKKNYQSLFIDFINDRGTVKTSHISTNYNSYKISVTTNGVLEYLEYALHEYANDLSQSDSSWFNRFVKDLQDIDVIPKSNANQQHNIYQTHANSTVPSLTTNSCSANDDPSNISNNSDVGGGSGSYSNCFFGFGHNNAESMPPQ